MAAPSIYMRSIWKIASHPGSSPGQAFRECALVLAIADADGAASGIDITPFRPSRFAEGDLAPEHNVI